MSLDTRSTVLSTLEGQLGAKLLCYVTGDRPGLETQISPDQVQLFRRHLIEIGQQEHIALLIHTRGGDTNSPWPIVNMIREHCERLTVLVPAIALSSGTLTALGADEIQMTRFASLSPIDPTVANGFNPHDPANPANRIPIAVEDLLAFLELVDSKQNLDKRGVLQTLCASVHPLALGNVQRSINMIRELARKMLTLAGEISEADLEALVKGLTTGFYSHGHMINRREAKQMQLRVVDPDPTVEQLLLDYLAILTEDLQLTEKFDPAALLRASTSGASPGLTTTTGMAVAPASVSVKAERAYVETPTTCDAFTTEGTVSQQVITPPPTPAAPVPVPQNAIAFEIYSDRWVQVR